MFWLNFLHFYQPPTQIDLIIKLITKENYQKVINILKRVPRAKIILNIPGSLTERLSRYGQKKIIKDIRTLAENGQIQFTETAKFHSILPLLPEEEIKRQIKLNRQTNEHYFGKIYQPEGFFPPEMFYTKKLGRLIKELGYKWIILDEICYQGKLGQVRFDRIYQTREGLKIFFQNRRLSRYFSFWKPLLVEKYFQKVKENINRDQFLVTAADGEMFGHHYKGREKFLEKILQKKSLKTVFPAEILKKYKKIEEIETRFGSWSSLEGEKTSRLWNNPDNEIQNLQWKLVKLALKTIKKVSPKIEGFLVARNAIDSFLYSCQFWWASCWPWWSLEEIEKGSRGFVMALKALKDKKFQKVQKEAEALYNKILQIAIDWHLSGEAQRRIDQFDRHYKDKWIEI